MHPFTASRSPAPATAAKPPRSSAGCWTCRLRRKKCDEARPVCDGCAALEIQCLYSEARPAWMDSGPRQKLMTDRLKAAVKDRAVWRREKRFVRDIEAGAAALRLASTAPDDDDGADDGAASMHIFLASEAVAGTEGVAEEMSTAPAPQPPSTPPAATTAAAAADDDGSILDDSTDFSSAGAAPAFPHSAVFQEPPPGTDQERNLSLIMIYLDYVFPFLYPFCRPAFLAGGRGWLLVQLMKNKAVYHSAMSLSAYFMAVIVNSNIAAVAAAVEEHAARSGRDQGSLHGSCVASASDEMHRQQELSLRELQRTIAAISRRQGGQTATASTASTASTGNRLQLERARALGSILQLLSFETVLQRLDGWHVHLDAAVALFEQTMDQAEGPSALDPAGLLPAAPFSPSSFSPPSFSSLPWIGVLLRPNAPPMPRSADQEAFDFYASVLLYMDVVTSASADQAPRLQRFHALLRPSVEDAPAASSRIPPRAVLEVHTVVGVRNWVLLALADAAALVAWKNAAVAARRLSVVELVARAAPIERALRAGLQQLDEDDARAQGSLSGTDEAGFFSAFIRHGGSGSGIPTPPTAKPPYPPSPPSAAVSADSYSHVDGAKHLPPDATSRIWALATLAYLLVAVNGWQPAADGVRQAVDATVAALAALPTASCLRIAAWPLCVAGCLATAESGQRDVLRGMAAQICGRTELYGAVQEAMRIMEAVWRVQVLQEQTAANGDSPVGSSSSTGGPASSTGSATGADWDFGRCFNILGRRPFLL